MTKPSASPASAFFSAIIASFILSILHLGLTARLIPYPIISYMVIPAILGWASGMQAVKTLERDNEKAREEYMFIPVVCALIGIIGPGIFAGFMYWGAIFTY